MTTRIEITDALLAALHAHNFLPNYNAAAPARGCYGWLAAGGVLDLAAPDELAIEECSGLYGGAYKPLPGGRKYCGLASVGAFTYSYAALPEPVRIGRYGSISSGVRFLDSTHPTHTVTSSAFTFRPRNKLFQRHVTPEVRDFAARFEVSGGRSFPRLGHDVWIGANVALAMGITIGTGAIVAYGSVVTQDVPPYAIVGGSPASVKKMRFPAELAARLLAARWWDLDPGFVFRHEFADPDALCNRIERERASIAPFMPQRFDFMRFVDAAVPQAVAA